MNYKKTIAALAMVAIMVPTSLPALSNAPIMSSISITQTLTTNAATGRLYYQKSSTWSKELQSSGCGLFSTANAIYALNGKKMDINALASWAKSNGGWKPGKGTVRDTLFSNITSKYGNSYGFKVVSKKYGNVDDKTLQNHLSNGGVAIAHVGTPEVNGHFIALVGYKNNQFLVIDSVNNRCAGINGYAWMSSSFLKSTASSNRTRVDWFCLISKNGTTTPLNNCFPKYTGSSTSIVTALKALGIDSSYDYRKKIATANSISNYSGTASQNTTMLNKLKAGTLIKPGTSTPTTSVTYFKKYTGTSTSIVTALNAIGVDSSYAYRQKIAAKNGISGYTGTASQNTTMLNKLKAGTLIKP